jgi:hypothetical protein
MKAHVGVEVELHTFLISTLDGNEWLASCLGRNIPGERDPGTYCIGGLECQSECFGEENNLLPLTGISNRQPGHCTDFTTPAPH